MTETVRPTKKQRVLLDFIEKFIGEHGYSPSYREIMNGCDYNSIATVAVHINNLISRGHLRKRDHSGRSLELTDRAHGSGNADQATASDGDDGQPQSTEAVSETAGRQWLLECTGKKVREAESLLPAQAKAGAEVKVKAQVAYNEAQTLMATLRIMQNNSSGQLSDAMEARMQEFTDRLQALEDMMATGELA